MNKNNNSNDAEKHLVEYFVDGKKYSEAAEDMAGCDIKKLSSDQIVGNIAYFGGNALLEGLNNLDIDKSSDSLENYMKRKYKTTQERYEKYFELLEKRPEVLPFCEVEFIKQNIKQLVEKGFFNKYFQPLYFYFGSTLKENHSGMANKIIRDLKNIDERDDLLFDLMLACFNSSIDIVKKQARIFFYRLSADYVYKKILEGKYNNEFKFMLETCEKYLGGADEDEYIVDDFIKDVGDRLLYNRWDYMRFLDISGVFIKFVESNFIAENINSKIILDALKYLDQCDVGEVCDQIKSNENYSGEQKKNLIKQASDYNHLFVKFWPYEDILNSFDNKSVKKYLSDESLSETRIKEIMDCLAVDKTRDEKQKKELIKKLCSYNFKFVAGVKSEDILDNLDDEDDEVVKKYLSATFLAEEKMKEILDCLANDKARDEEQKKELIKKLCSYNFKFVAGMESEDILNNVDDEAIKKYFGDKSLDETKIKEILDCLAVDKTRDEKQKKELIKKLCDYNFKFVAGMKSEDILNNVNDKAVEDFLLDRIKSGDINEYIGGKKNKNIWRLYYLNKYGYKDNFSKLGLNSLKEFYDMYKTANALNSKYKPVASAMKKFVFKTVIIELLITGYPAFLFFIPGGQIIAIPAILGIGTFCLGVDVSAIFFKKVIPMAKNMFLNEMNKIKKCVGNKNIAVDSNRIKNNPKNNLDDRLAKIIESKMKQEINSEKTEISVDETDTKDKSQIKIEPLQIKNNVQEKFEQNQNKSQSKNEDKSVNKTNNKQSEKSKDDIVP